MHSLSVAPCERAVDGEKVVVFSFTFKMNVNHTQLLSLLREFRLLVRDDDESVSDVVAPSLHITRTEVVAV